MKVKMMKLKEENFVSFELCVHTLQLKLVIKFHKYISKLKLIKKCFANVKIIDKSFLNNEIMGLYIALHSWPKLIGF